MSCKRSILLCIDIEPLDRGELTARFQEEWEGLGELAERLSSLRSRLESVVRLPVHFNWFIRIDPQIEYGYGSLLWPVRRYRALFDAWEAHGDEIGIHTHAWRWDDRARLWVADHADQAWVEHCIHVAVETYREAFGRLPKSFRFGDRWMNDATLTLLERMGIAYDLTPEPGHKAVSGLRAGEHTTGAIPDYTSVPHHPYQPSRFNFTRSGRWLKRNIWVLPVSTGCINGPVVPTTSDPAHAYVSLNFAFHNRIFERILNGLLDLTSNQPLILVMRSGDYASPEYHPQIDENLSLLADHPRLAELSFDTPEEAVRKYSAYAGKRRPMG
jgi:hypothetical protein